MAPKLILTKSNRRLILSKSDDQPILDLSSPASVPYDEASYTASDDETPIIFRNLA